MTIKIDYRRERKRTFYIIFNDMMLKCLWSILFCESRLNKKNRSSEWDESQKQDFIISISYSITFSQEKVK